MHVVLRYIEVVERITAEKAIIFASVHVNLWFSV